MAWTGHCKSASPSLETRLGALAIRPAASLSLLPPIHSHTVLSAQTLHCANAMAARAGRQVRLARGVYRFVYKWLTTLPFECIDSAYIGWASRASQSWQ